MYAQNKKTNNRYDTHVQHHMTTTALNIQDLKQAYMHNQMELNPP